MVLRGISFGNFLIKQVMAELTMELPWLKHYATFSPMPGFAAALERAGAPESPFTRHRLERLLEDFAADLRNESGIEDSPDALMKLLEKPLQHRDLLSAPLQRLALAYLALAKRGNRVMDPVALFHLNNGARLERINPFADDSQERLAASYGVMVNYRYDGVDLERNHEQFVANGEIALSRPLAKEHARLMELWKE